MTQLLTSIAEIQSFNPCHEGLERLMEGREGKGDIHTLFPISETTDYCTFSDVAWLLRKRRNTEILKNAARKCADSVRHLDNKYARRAAAAATATATAAAAYAYAAYAADAAAYAYAAAAYAADDAAAAAYAAAAYAADDYAAYAAAAAAAYNKQTLLNLSFLKEAIQEFESSSPSSPLQSILKSTNSNHPI